MLRESRLNSLLAISVTLLRLLAVLGGLMLRESRRKSLLCGSAILLLLRSRPVAVVLGGERLLGRRFLGDFLL